MKLLLHKNFGKFQHKLGRADPMTLFLLFTLVLAENRASADVVTFFFALHLILDEKLRFCGSDDLFVFFLFT